jgi:Ran GTPase-activating protein (RanGAP) involved in mRNA processing and transport
MKLYKFKAEHISRLISIKQQYADNARIQEIIDNHLIPKLQHLRAMDLADYIFTLYLASREFKVFEELIPSEETVNTLIEQKNKLYYFKAKYLARLLKLRKELKQKYKDKADRIETIVFELAARLHVLRRDGLTDYLFTATLACREFAEFCQLVPTENEIKTLFVVSEEG